MESKGTWAAYAGALMSRIQSVQDETVYPLARRWKAEFPELDSGNDARVHWFIGAARALNNFKLGYICIIQMSNPIWWQPVVKCQPPPESDIKDWICEFETSVIWAYVHTAWMITEETFRLLSRALDGSEVAEIKNIYARILKLAAVQNLEPLFDLCRLIRNTTHTNAIFLPRSSKDVTVQWKGQVYEFRVGQGMAFISPQVVIDIFGRELSECMNLVMSMPSIQGLPVITRRVTARNKR